MTIKQTLRRLTTIERKLTEVLEPVLTGESPLNFRDGMAAATARSMVRKVLTAYKQEAAR